ncbi:hypothetical protein B5C34_04950 [Pacificimonas flava]|uniref:Uncharacterized protein n=2 Tax=Pacificimonas TaxID=1960290 RepID=A0A219B403_9SPHN|nr:MULTISPECIES: hypothetical protein [Pacificimonas]MBZ6377435.1 hypothetical protein [Pacificimonas aurantium]OWV32863.1 hypothetical protein B5C34_04950 [Pacificimonas flava]
MHREVNRLLETGKSALRAELEAAGAGTPEPSPLIYSNEMLLVDGNLRWQEKLRLIGEELAAMDPVFLVTCRKPPALLRSLYAELQVSGGYRTFSAFLRSNQAAIADLETVDAELARFGDRYYVDFDVLTGTRFSILRDVTADITIPADFGAENQRGSTAAGIVTRKYTLRERIASLPGAKAARRLLPGGLRRRLASTLEAVSLGDRGVIPYETAEEVDPGLLESFSSFMAEDRADGIVRREKRAGG